MPVDPDVVGQRWNLQFVVTPAIPKLIKGHLLEDYNVNVTSWSFRENNREISQSYIARHFDPAGIRHVCTRRCPRTLRNGRA
jgi:hypothetical protein